MPRILSFPHGVLFGSLVAMSAVGQQTGIVQGVISAQRLQAGTMTITSGGAGRRVPPAATGMPYSAEQVTETVQTLADGTHIRQTQHAMVMYRDSAGRTRTETPIGPFGRTNTDTPKMVRIVDVVGGYEYTLDDQNKVAHRVTVQVAQPTARRTGTGGAVGGGMLGSTATLLAMPTVAGFGPAVAAVGPALRANASGPMNMPRPEMQSEDLGTQMIEGVTARGRRTTQTWPVDSVGNDRPIVVVFESWQSDQLGGMSVLSKSNDPRHGETTTSLKNVNLSEPDPSLFQPPAGYQIVDESGSFQITVPRPSATATQNQ